MVKPSCARRRWRTAKTFPSVKTDVMMIIPGRNKRGITTEANHSLESQHPTIKF